jgi:SHS2 domain-containing protein
MVAVYRWVDHTAELELRVEAASEEGVFREALAALGELLREHSPGDAGEPARHALSASAPDRATLLAEWLSELAFLAETRGFVPERVESLSLEGQELDAVVTGVHAAPPHLIKAVTYHRLELREHDGDWHARVVLDV